MSIVHSDIFGLTFNLCTHISLLFLFCYIPVAVGGRYVMSFCSS